MTNHDEQMKAVARLVSGRPDWIDAPAVQAWHRSDGRTEHDGTPGKPRIWSPDYRTTEHWSTPSLRNVHWSDLVDVVPLAAPAGSYTRTDEADWKARAEKAEQERDEARARAEKAEEVADLRRSEIVRLSQDRNDWEGNALDAEERAERAERERDEWKDSAIKAMADLERAEHPRPLTPDAITDAMIERARQRGSEIVGALWDASVVEAMLTAALTEPPKRPEGAEEIEALLTGSYAEPRYVADFLAERGVRVVTEEQP